jgi:hypothetical protein
VGEALAGGGRGGASTARVQGLTLVHFSAQPDPILKQKLTLHIA